MHTINFVGVVCFFLDVFLGLFSVPFFVLYILNELFPRNEKNFFKSLSPKQILKIVGIFLILKATFTICYLTLAKNKEIKQDVEIGYINELTESAKDSSPNIVTLSSGNKLCVSHDSVDYALVSKAFKQKLLVRINYSWVFISEKCPTDSIVQKITILQEENH